MNILNAFFTRLYNKNNTMSNFDFHEQKLIEARHLVTEKKSILDKKIAELVELNLRAECIKIQLDELINNRDECDLTIENNIQKANISMLEEKRKADLFKEINIAQNHMKPYSSTFISSSKLDNLISCVLSVTESKYFSVSLLNKNEMPQDSLYKDHSIKEKVKELKEALYISDKDEKSVVLDQDLVNQISSKIIERKLITNCQNTNNQCLLLNQSTEDTPIEDSKIILYEDEQSFLLLKQKPKIEKHSILSETHSIVNTLINAELIRVICTAKFDEKGASLQDDKSDLEKLYKAFKSIQQDLNKKVDNEINHFIEYIQPIDSISNHFSKKIVSKQIKLLSNLMLQVVEYSPEHQSMESEIKYLKKYFLRQTELIVQDECEKRRRQTEMQLKSDSMSTNAFKLEISHKQKEIECLEKEINKKTKELDDKLKEHDKKLEEIKLLNEYWVKQNISLEKEINMLNSELKEAELEFDKLKNNSTANKAQIERTKKNVIDLKSKIEEHKQTKQQLVQKEEEIKQSLELVTKDRSTLQSEKVIMVNEYFIFYN